MLEQTYYIIMFLKHYLIKKLHLIKNLKTEHCNYFCQAIFYNSPLKNIYFFKFDIKCLYFTL